MKNLPNESEVKDITRECQKNLKQGQDINQLTFEKIKKKYENKSKE